jgi:hypothetical protein
MKGATVYVLWGEWHEEAVYEVFGVYADPEAAWGAILDYALSPDNFHIDEDLEALCRAISELYGVEIETLRAASAFISKLKPAEYAPLVSEFQSDTNDIFLRLEEKKIGTLNVTTRCWC